MSNQLITLHMEIPPKVAQQGVWNLKGRLSQVAGVMTELRELKDLITATLLFIRVVRPYLRQAVVVAVIPAYICQAL